MVEKRRFWTEGGLLISDYFFFGGGFFSCGGGVFSCGGGFFSECLYPSFLVRLCVCLCVCYALFYPDRAFLFRPCLVIKFSLKLASLRLEWDSNSVLEYAPILLYQFSKLPTKIGRSIFNLNHTKKRMSNCNFTSFFEFEFTVFFFS